MKTLWIKLADTPQPFAIKYDHVERERFESFDDFLINYMTGWGENGHIRVQRWAVTNSPDIEPLKHEWKTPV